MSLLQAALLPSNLKQRILESGANFLLPQYQPIDLARYDQLVERAVRV